MPEPSVHTPSNSWKRTFFFMAIVCLCCAALLSIVSLSLKERQDLASKINRYQQMLIAAGMMDHDGSFILKETRGDSHSLRPVIYTEEGTISFVKEEERKKAVAEEILSVYQLRIRPFLVDERGDRTTFEELGIREDVYLQKHEKEGYAYLPWKIMYEILSPLPSQDQAETLSAGDEQDVQGYLLPVSGFGLWGGIYGYLAVRNDGNTVIGTTWYKHEETPGLGANITLPEWQDQFAGKRIFQPQPDGTTDFTTAPLQISVLKGEVAHLPENSPARNSSVDGLAGATITSKGVTQAYQSTLAPYRSFFIRLQG